MCIRDSRQADEAGWQVRRGEKSSVVEYWQWTREEKDATGQSIEVKLDAPRVFYAHVFNASQMDHVPELIAAKPNWKPEVEAQRILKNSGARIFHDPVSYTHLDVYKRQDQHRVSYPSALPQNNWQVLPAIPPERNWLCQTVLSNRVPIDQGDHSNVQAHARRCHSSVAH